MKRIIPTTFVLLAAMVVSQCGTSVAQTGGGNPYLATPHNSDYFAVDEQFSSEFDESVDTANWDICKDKFAVWSFKEENVTVEDGILNLTAKYDLHKPANRQYYFSSGMVRSRETIGYGYYEARIKGADLWPGVCPAFWLYTRNDRDKVTPRAENEVVYNEIDVIEIQQIARDKRMMACNMHIMTMIPDGKGDFKYDFVTSGKLPKMGRTEFPVEWDAEDEYHLYGCENRPDSVVFYIDNKRVGAKPNFFWHMKMYVTLSMGMRTPYEVYLKGGQRLPVETTAEQAEAAGFPTSMKIDYVRCYKRDYSEFKSSKRPFNCNDFK